MATEPSVLGFANRWYPLACRTAQSISLKADLPIRVVTSPLFVATKLEAFHGRGGGDLHESRDLEDVIAVVDGREELVAEAAASDPDVRAFLATELGALQAMPGFRSAVAGHLPPDAVSQARVDVVLDRIAAICRG